MLPDCKFRPTLHTSTSTNKSILSFSNIHFLSSAVILSLSQKASWEEDDYLWAESISSIARKIRTNLNEWISWWKTFSSFSLSDVATNYTWKGERACDLTSLRCSFRPFRVRRFSRLNHEIGRSVKDSWGHFTFVGFFHSPHSNCKIVSLLTNKESKGWTNEHMSLKKSPLGSFNS